MSSETDRNRVYVVSRARRTSWPGAGLAGGLGVVMKHFRDAFAGKLDSPSKTSGLFTV